MNVAAATIAVDWKSYLANNYDHSAVPERYRWVEGEIIAVGGETTRNALIAMKLGRIFDAAIGDRPWTTFINHMEVEVNYSKHQTRIPDVMIVSSNTLDLLGDEDRIITLDMPPPVLMVEIVSPSSIKTDIEEKELEYLDREIGEYISIDWRSQSVVVRTRKDGKSYTYNQYGPGERVVLESFPTMVITVDEMISR